jgi:4-amino-4-deoxy-L-arabinose transferase-like glycosyltransferase
VILGVGIGARLAVLLFYLSTHGWQGETWEYEEIAKNLLEGRGFTIFHHNMVFRSFVVPVFPVVSAFLHWIGGPGLGLFYAFHLATAAAIIVLTYAIASRWFDNRTASIAALLVALEPGLIIYHSYKVDVIALSSLLLLLGIYLFVLSVETGRQRPAWLAGVVAGLGILTRPDLIAILVTPLAWLVVRRNGFRMNWQNMAVFWIAALLVVIPWLGRNYHVHGKWVMSTIAGETLWIGNNPHASGTTLTLNNRDHLDLAPEEFRRTVAQLSEIERDAFYREQAVEYIKADPGGFVRRAGNKIMYFWWFSPTYAWRYYDWLPRFLPGVYKDLYAFLLGMAIYGSWTALRSSNLAVRPLTLSLLLVPMAIAFIHSVNFVEGRHRLLVMPMILILAAHGMATIIALCCAARRGQDKLVPHASP